VCWGNQMTVLNCLWRRVENKIRQEVVLLVGIRNMYMCGINKRTL
jgi:hypothetical protein